MYFRDKHKIILKISKYEPAWFGISVVMFYQKSVKFAPVLELHTDEEDFQGI